MVCKILFFIRNLGLKTNFDAVNRVTRDLLLIDSGKVHVLLQCLVLLHVHALFEVLPRLKFPWIWPHLVT